MASEELTRLAEQLRGGSRRALSRAITLIESTRADHREQAHALLAELSGESGSAVRVGISGPPGAGKSTLIEAFGYQRIEAGDRVAVLAVDPSSQRGGGSILGDKTRMERLSTDPRAFVRPSPSGLASGGVARRTRESIALCEAAGFNLGLVETLGVGQAETAVAGMTDCFVLVLPPAGGDELQGIKRGIVELADVILVNKADGPLAAAAADAVADYSSALRMMPSHGTRGGSAVTAVRAVSALDGTGLVEGWEAVTNYIALARDAGRFATRRQEQAQAALDEELLAQLADRLRRSEDFRGALESARGQVADGLQMPSVAAAALLESVLG